jgi:hypothetical protein
MGTSRGTTTTWREPLSDLCTAATDAGFLIEKVIEPRPAATVRERHPDDCEKLTRAPGSCCCGYSSRASRVPASRD